MFEPASRDRVVVQFAGAQAGTQPLTWGQKAILQDMQDSGNQFSMGGRYELPEGSSVEDAAARLSGLVGRHASLRMRLRTDGAGRVCQEVAGSGRIGLRSRLLVRDREMLISGPKRGFTPLAPVRLADCKPLKIVAPGPDNTRRRNLETYFQTHGVEIEAMLDMDAMIGTLEFVARSDWTTILPSVISVNDIGRGELIVNPIVEPELHAEFVVIQPARRTLSTPARMFLQRFEQEVAHIHDVWDAAIAAPKRRRA